MKIKSVFGVVIYNQALKWVNEFSESVSSQSCQDFDLLIINDGVENDYLEKLKSITSKTIIIDSSDNATVSDNRKLLLKEAKEYGYDLLILGDFDDVFLSDRISRVIDGIDNEHTFYYHNIICNNVDIFSNLPNEVLDIESILQYNFLGMSNTAIDIRRLTYEWIESLEEVSTNVFDWYLFSRLLLDGFYGKYIPGSYTIYRQSEINLVGKQDFSIENIQKEVSVKINHYWLLKEKCEKANRLYNLFVKGIYDCILEDELKHDRHGYWWENVIIELNKFMMEDLGNV